MGKILCFVYDTMADFEITLACHILRLNADKELITISYGSSPITAASKLKYIADCTVDQATLLDDVDALIIPGGYERECRPELIALIKKLHTNKKLICAICAAPEFLAKTGILHDHSYTTTLSKEHLATNGITDFFPWQNYVDEKIVRHENIITAKGVSFIDFAIEIADYFTMFTDENEKQMYSKAYKGE